MVGKPEAVNIGADKSYKTPEQAWHGVYRDGVETAPIVERFQEQLMPKAPDPSPYVLRG